MSKSGNVPSFEEISRGREYKVPNHSEFYHLTNVTLFSLLCKLGEGIQLTTEWSFGIKKKQAVCFYNLVSMMIFSCFVDILGSTRSPEELAQMIMPVAEEIVDSGVFKHTDKYLSMHSNYFIPTYNFIYTTCFNAVIRQYQTKNTRLRTENKIKINTKARQTLLYFASLYSQIIEKEPLLKIQGHVYFHITKDNIFKVDPLDGKSKFDGNLFFIGGNPTILFDKPIPIHDEFEIDLIGLAQQITGYSHAEFTALAKKMGGATYSGGLNKSATLAMLALLGLASANALPSNGLTSTLDNTGQTLSHNPASSSEISGVLPQAIELSTTQLASTTLGDSTLGTGLLVAAAAAAGASSSSIGIGTGIGAAATTGLGAAASTGTGFAAGTTFLTSSASTVTAGLFTTTTATTTTTLTLGVTQAAGAMNAAALAATPLTTSSALASLGPAVAGHTLRSGITYYAPGLVTDVIAKTVVGTTVTTVSWGAIALTGGAVLVVGAGVYYYRDYIWGTSPLESAPAQNEPEQTLQPLVPEEVQSLPEYGPQPASEEYKQSIKNQEAAKKAFDRAVRAEYEALVTAPKLTAKNPNDQQKLDVINGAIEQVRQKFQDKVGSEGEWEDITGLFPVNGPVNQEVTSFGLQTPPQPLESPLSGLTPSPDITEMPDVSPEDILFESAYSMALLTAFSTLLLYYYTTINKNNQNMQPANDMDDDTVDTLFKEYGIEDPSEKKPIAKVKKEEEEEEEEKEEEEEEEEDWGESLLKLPEKKIQNVDEKPKWWWGGKKKSSFRKTIKRTKQHRRKTNKNKNKKRKTHSKIKRIRRKTKKY